MRWNCVVNFPLENWLKMIWEKQLGTTDGSRRWKNDRFQQFPDFFLPPSKWHWLRAFSTFFQWLFIDRMPEKEFLTTTELRTSGRCFFTAPKRFFIIFIIPVFVYKKRLLYDFMFKNPPKYAFSFELSFYRL